MLYRWMILIANAYDQLIQIGRAIVNRRNGNKEEETALVMIISYQQLGDSMADLFSQVFNRWSPIGGTRSNRLNA